MAGTATHLRTCYKQCLVYRVVKHSKTHCLLSSNEHIFSNSEKTGRGITKYVSVKLLVHPDSKALQLKVSKPKVLHCVGKYISKIGQVRLTRTKLCLRMCIMLRHGTCHFNTRYTSISKINSVYGNLIDQMKLDLCKYEALSYTSVP